MCTPELIVAGTVQGLDLVNSIYQIESQKAIGKFNEKLARQKAQIAEKDAAYERQKGIEDSREAKLKAIQNMASVKADIAGGNIMTSSSTALNLIEDEKQEGELEALKIIDSSEKASESYLRKAKDYYADASWTSFKTRTDYVSGYLGLAKFGNKGYDIYDKYQKTKKYQNNSGCNITLSFFLSHDILPPKKL